MFNCTLLLATSVKFIAAPSERVKMMICFVNSRSNKYPRQDAHSHSYNKHMCVFGVLDWEPLTDKVNLKK